MKKLFCLLVFALMLGCSADTKYEVVEDGVVAAAKITSERLFGGPIGTVDKLGEMSLLKDQESILSVFNSLLKKSHIDANLTRVELVKYKEVYSLRGYGDGYRSTMLLIVDGAGNLVAPGVTCTTKNCATTTGCAATQEMTCTPCSGDCEKTTTA